MNKLLKIVFVLALLILAIPSVSKAATLTGFAWGENVGWIDFSRVVVNANNLSGYAYGENIGWISLNCNQQPSGANTCSTNNYAVLKSSSGALSGFAWGENVGWIDFSRVSINPSTGAFSGYAYGENIGWISLNCSNTNTCGTNPYNVTRPVSATTYTVSGAVKYYSNSSRGISGATVSLTNNLGQSLTTTTDTNGGYQFTVSSGSNNTITVSKVETSITGFNVQDLTLTISNILNGAFNGNVYKIAAADMDNDGNVNITDVTRMVSSVLNERIMTTQTSGWRIYPSNVTLNSSNYLTIAGTRNVNNAISNVTSIDFLGVKVGDTNGSW